MVVKVISPEILHKSDAGGVRVNLATPEAVRDAVADMAVAPKIKGKRVDGYLIEEMAPPYMAHAASSLTSPHPAKRTDCTSRRAPRPTTRTDPPKL